jgi:hypothetical protein
MFLLDNIELIRSLVVRYSTLAHRPVWKRHKSEDWQVASVRIIGVSASIALGLKLIGRIAVRVHPLAHAEALEPGPSKMKK